LRIGKSTDVGWRFAAVWEAVTGLLLLLTELLLLAGLLFLGVVCNAVGIGKEDAELPEEVAEGKVAVAGLFGMMGGGLTFAVGLLGVMGIEFAADGVLGNK
jgi:hypothetical protein